MVVMINLSDTDDPYLIFESLNFKGSPLEQSDLVRNYFLMRFTVTDQQGVYDGLWLPMQNRLGQGLTEFMRHFLGAEGEEVRKGDVYTAVRETGDRFGFGVRAHSDDAHGAAVCPLQQALWRRRRAEPGPKSIFR